MTEMMKAVRIVGGELAYGEVPRPVPRAGELLVRVAATAVNRADLLQVQGLYPAPFDAPQDIPGLEYAGEVAAIGEGVPASDFSLGDRVFGLVGGGSYAEYVAVHHRAVARIPAAVTAPLTEVAAVPEAFLTAYDAIVTQGGLAAGDTLLIHAVGSGVGTAAAQIGHGLGAVVVGTARSPEKLERAKEYGLLHGIVPGGPSPSGPTPTFATAVLAATGGRGVDVALDLVGGAYVVETVAAMALGGRILLVGLTGGRTADVDLGALLRKRVRIQGTVLRSRPLEERIALHAVLERRIAPRLATGAYRPVVDAVLPLAEAAEAHRRIASNGTFGKVVLVP